MALNVSVSLNYDAYSAGQNPPPQATLTVYNPNASTVIVTGVKMYAFDVNDPVGRELDFASGTPPLGPNQPTAVAALGTLTIGPFPVVVGSAANANSYQSSNPVGRTLVNSQLAHPPQSILGIGCVLYASDGSVNRAAWTPLQVSYTSSPPLGYQGGFCFFNGPNNCCLVAAGVA
jgi:hypothetical protein